MADMKKVYDDLIIINLYCVQAVYNSLHQTRHGGFPFKNDKKVVLHTYLLKSFSCIM